MCARACARVRVRVRVGVGVGVVIHAAPGDFLSHRNAQPRTAPTACKCDHAQGAGGAVRYIAYQAPELG